MIRIRELRPRLPFSTMRVYIAHRLTGEKLDDLRPALEHVSDTIAAAGHEPFIFLRDIENWHINALPAKETMERCFEEIDKSDIVFVYVYNDKKSEGMLMECGYAKARNKRFIIAIREGIQFQWLPHLSEKSFYYIDDESLDKKVKEAFQNE